MVISLDSSPKKLAFLTGFALFACAFLATATRHYLASHYAGRADLRWLQRAIRLDPGNADYHLMLARYLSATGTNSSAAAEEYRLATRLNPHDAQAWFGLAGIAQVLDDSATQRFALQQAISMDQTTPELAWQAANFFLVQGDTDNALKEFRVVIDNEPDLTRIALNLVIHAVDVDTVIHRVLPPKPGAYLDFLDLLTARKDSEGAAQVWSALVRLGAPLERGQALSYVNYLILQQQVEQATVVWRQALHMAGLAGYETSRENLIVNPNFDSPLLNSGFDWHYDKRANLIAALDPIDFHNGHRSLSVVFDGPGVNDIGVFQFIPVEPDTAYDFSAFYKAADMDGAGGPRFSISDAYTGATYYLSDDLKNAEVWRESEGTFKTSSATQLLVLRVVRIPAGSPIRGHLWIDDFHLLAK